MTREEFLIRMHTLIEGDPRNWRGEFARILGVKHQVVFDSINDGPSDDIAARVLAARRWMDRPPPEWVRTVAQYVVSVVHAHTPRMLVERERTDPPSPPVWYWMDPPPDDPLALLETQTEALRLVTLPPAPDPLAPPTWYGPPRMSRVEFLCRLVPLVQREGRSWAVAAGELLSVLPEYMPRTVSTDPSVPLSERLEVLERIRPPTEPDEWYRMRVGGVSMLVHPRAPRHLVERLPTGALVWHWLDPEPTAPHIRGPLIQDATARLTPPSQAATPDTTRGGALT